MAKVKRKNLKMKRRVRKTFGAVFLISSLLVAAIPVDGIKASTNTGTQPSVTIAREDSNIPELDPSDMVYTSEDGMYNFCYVDPSETGSGTKVAVIVGYNDNVPGAGSNVVIPAKFDAYLGFDESTGLANPSSSPTAVNEGGEFLFYKTQEQKTDAYGNLLYEQKEVLDEDGNVKGYEDDLTKPIMISNYKPCYFSTKDIEGGWVSSANAELYYREDPSSADYQDDNNFKVATGSKARLQNIEVQYIANQSLGADRKPGPWIDDSNISDGTTKGVFSEKGQITQISFPVTLRGIGDYAFHRCTGLQNVDLSSGISNLGNHAFDGCINLQKITIPSNCGLITIGDHAFYNCQTLDNFTMPVPTVNLGDGAFENCYNLKNLVLYRNGENIALANIGNHAFKNCTELEAITFPGSVDGKVDIGILEGCENLKKVTMMSRTAYFDDSSFSFEQFKKNLDEGFYFEGYKSSDENDNPAAGTLHSVAHENSIAFKYLNEDIYEMVKTHQETDGSIKKAIFRVNSQNELTACKIEPGMTLVEIPGVIGPYKITTVSSTGFSHNCSLQEVIIPKTVSRIEDNAFLGCHNLRHVIFEDADAIEYLGKGAFKTQIADTHQSICPMAAYADATAYLNSGTVSDADKEAYLNPVLTFTGTIGNNEPYKYAMNKDSDGNYLPIDKNDNRVNAGTQSQTYVTYYSGWPTNLTVRFNPEKGKSELINYPLMNTIMDYDKATYPYMNDDYLSAASALVNKINAGESLTEDEKYLNDAILYLDFPEGIDAFKDGLFRENESMERSGLEKTVTTHSVTEIEDETFAGCKNMVAIDILGDTLIIGDHAFEDCEKLANVEISDQVQVLGKIPFTGCPNLTNLSFEGGPYYVCDNGLVFKLDQGQKTELVECLESRGIGKTSSNIEAGEVKDILSIAESAFYNCSGVTLVDLKESKIESVPSYAFAASEKSNSGLSRVELPRTCKTIKENAFKNSKVSYLVIPTSVSNISENAFNTTENSPQSASSEKDGIQRDEYNNITFYCEADSNAASYAGEHENINITEKEKEIYHKVVFAVLNDAGEYYAIKTEDVLDGKGISAPEVPPVTGKIFIDWDRQFDKVTGPMEIRAQYKDYDPNEELITVIYCDDQGNPLSGSYYKVQTMPGVEPEKPPVNPEKPGYSFKGWTAFDLKSTAKEQKILAIFGDLQYTVTFLDYTGTPIAERLVIPGQTVAAPDISTVAAPKGMKCVGWNEPLDNIQSTQEIHAKYDVDDSASPAPGATPSPAPGTTPSPAPGTTQSPAPGTTQSPAPGTTQSPAPGTTQSPAPGTSPSPAPGNQSFYTLTVKNGSGSGSYIAGAQVIVIANNPASNQEFVGWSIDPSTVQIASKDAMGTVITMPAQNVTMTANYKAKSGSGSSTTPQNNTGTTGNGSTDKRPTNGGSSNNGTTVVISKNGLSNTNCISAVVNGSSDNFVVKLQESSVATERAIKALMARYPDLSGIMYFPVDIALYDATGTNLITDTTGLSITVTVPIPDSMIAYAGNNKVAYVGNETLEDLNVRFTSINGVPCMTFTANKFNPASYCIYVDTNHLSQGASFDSTPKTGDGIHPKWFLSLGLMCISMVLFLKKDKKRVARA